MTFNWKDYFELAKYIKSQNYLQTENLEEAAKRSLVSRAYYSAFKASVNLFSQLGFIPANNDADHSAIRDYLRRKNITSFNEISNK